MEPIQVASRTEFVVNLWGVATAAGVLVLAGLFFWIGFHAFSQNSDRTSRFIGAMAIAAAVLLAVADALTLVMNGPRFLGLLLAAVAAVPVTLVWLITLVDCATKEPSQGNDKIVWVLIILFLNIIGAALYLLSRRPQRVMLSQSIS